MRRFLYSCVAGLAVLCGGTVSADPVAELETYFERAEAYGFSGSILIARDGEVVLEGAYGYADHARGIRAEADTAFGTGSITKQFTAAAILHLEAAGKLSMGDSIADYLDFVPEEKRAVTLHHLLNHTSGLGDSYWDQNRDLSEGEYLRQKMTSGTLRSVSGEQFAYSNFGYHLLKAIVEKVSGQSYESYLHEYLFLPAGMERTGYALPAWGENGVAHYQDWTTRSSDIEVQNPLGRPIYLQPEGSGGILSTPRDLYKWHLALLGDDILSPDAKARMFTSGLSRYGYGWRIYDTARDTTVIEHGVYDSWLGTNAGFYRYIEDDLVIIVQTNTMLDNTLRHDLLVPRIESMIFGWSMPTPPEPVKCEGDISKYVGDYSVGSMGTVKVSVQNDRLILSGKDEAVIGLLTFPKSTLAGGEDTEAVRFARAMSEDDFEDDGDTFDSRIDAERFVRQWQGGLRRLVRKHGELKRIHEVHEHGGVFLGRAERVYYLHLEFEDGEAYYRFIRADAGWLNASAWSFPEQIELTLAPASGGTFQAWNFRINMGPRLRLRDDGTLSFVAE